MNKEAAELNDRIAEHRNNAARLLRQAASMREVAKGFNTVEQKLEAINISVELTKEATIENTKASELLVEYLAKHGDQ